MKGECLLWKKEITVVFMFPLMVAETDSNYVVQHFIDCEADHAAIEIHSVLKIQGKDFFFCSSCKICDFNTS